MIDKKVKNTCIVFYSWFH